MTSERARKRPQPLDEAALERLAVHYVGRYATTRAKLASYLQRKLNERGWEDQHPPAVAHLVQRLHELGYVDDRAFAIARTASLQRRGLGERRIAQSLRAAGIADDDAAEAKEFSGEDAWNAVLRFAQKKKLGPYGSAPFDPKRRERAFASLARAGHSIELIRKLLSMTTDDVQEWD